MTSLKGETITNSVVNLSHVGTQESKQVEILTKLSITLSYNCGTHPNQNRSKIADMLFDTLAQYRARKNFDTFWVEIDNFFGSVLAYESIYDDYNFQTIEKSLQDLNRFPTLLAQFNVIYNRRKLALEQAREKQRIADENWAKYLREVKKDNGLTICIGTGTSVQAALANATVIKPPVNLSKTTRSGLKY